MGRFPINNLVDEEGNVWHTNERRLARINHAVKGAHLVVPFQCEYCWIRLLEGREASAKDAMYLACLRRANLDAIAGRSKSTIEQHTSRMNQVIQNCARIGKTPSFPPRGPFPDYDCVGMGTAVDMLVKSLYSKGRNQDHVQFDTLRQVRSSATVSYQSSAVGMREGSAFSRGTGSVRPTNCNTQSLWFLYCLLGMEYRMGHESRANQGIEIRAIIEILRRAKRRAEDLVHSDPKLSNYYYRVGAMIAILTGGSLRGNEGFFLCLLGLRRHLGAGRHGSIPENYTLHHLFSDYQARSLPHVVLTLLGDFKGENNSDYHLLIVANVTQSGLDIRWWVEKLVAVCEAEGRSNGPAFAGPDGMLESSLDYDATFKELAKEVQDTTDLIPSDLEVDTWLGLSRTPRKSAETRATQAGVPKEIKDAMNRWSTVERSKGKRTRWKNTRDTYTSAVGEMPNTWRYSRAL